VSQKWCLVLMFAVGLGTLAHAEPPMSPVEREREAKARFERGEALYRRGEYDAARLEFEAGYALKPLPVFLFDIAQSYRRSGQRERAIEYYRRFLEVDASSRFRAQAERYLRELEQEAEPRPAPAATPTVAPAPPPGSVTPVPSAPVAAPASVVATPASAAQPAPRKRRLWIVGVVVGGVVVVGGAVALGVLLGRSNGPPDSDLGNFQAFP
jgi:tetratricopeptide (TPR) repeat protein